MKLEFKKNLSFENVLSDTQTLTGEEMKLTGRVQRGFYSKCLTKILYAGKQKGKIQWLLHRPRPNACPCSKL